MAISFVNESHSPGLSGYAGSVTINVPSGVQEDDLLFAVVGGTRDGAPSGWTLLGSASQGSSTGTVYLYYRIADSSEPFSYTFTFDGVKYSKNHSILAYRGVDTSDPIGDSDVKADSGTLFDTNSISVTSGQWVASYGTHYTFGDDTVRTWSVNSGTQRADYGDALNFQENSSMGWFDSAGGVSSGTVSRDLTCSSSSSVGTAGIVAFNPAVPEGTDHSISPSDTLTLSDTTERDAETNPFVLVTSFQVNIGFTP